MSDMFSIAYFMDLYTEHQRLIFLIGVMSLIFFPMLYIVRKFLQPFIDKLLLKREVATEVVWHNYKITKYITHIFLGIYLFVCGEIFEQEGFTGPISQRIEKLAITIYLLVFINSLLNTIIQILVDIYHKRARKIPIRFYGSITRYAIYSVSFLIVLSNILSIPISTVLTSLGAAVVMLGFVFKDTLLGLMASLQLTLQDIIRPGDWVSIPKFSADGDVESISVNFIKIRNFDKTVTTVPTAALLTTGIKNWRSMQESGGRRIKRFMYIDIDSIHFCSQSILDKIKKLDCMTIYAKENKEKF